MSVETEIQILELASDLIACDPQCASMAISLATDRLLAPPNYKYSDWVAARVAGRWSYMSPDERGFADVKLDCILSRLGVLREQATTL